jgi:hypothetical protein
MREARLTLPRILEVSSHLPLISTLAPHNELITRIFEAV